MNAAAHSRAVAGPVAVVVNPRAANGRAARAWRELRPLAEAALGTLEIFETAEPDHGTELARMALRGGAKSIIAVGGDGTISEVVNGFFENDQSVAPGAALGILPQGSSSDLRRTLALPLDGRAALEIIRAGRLKRIDVASAQFDTTAGRPGRRYGVNISSFGMGGLVAARANRSSKLLGGRLTFQLTTLLATLGFRGNRVRLRLDGRDLGARTISNVAVGNAQFHGGGMWVCPRAAVDDGLLDVTVVRYLPPWEVALAFRVLYNGKLYTHPKVEFHRAARVEATAEETTLIEVDGEAVGRLPLTIAVLPRALPVYVPGA